MDKTTTLMIRAACGVVLLVPVAFGMLWLRREAAVKECVVSALTRQFEGDRNIAEIIYNTGDEGWTVQTRRMLSRCKLETKLLG